MSRSSDDSAARSRAFPATDRGGRPDRVPTHLLERLGTLHGAGGRIRRRLLLHGRELLRVRPTSGFPRVFGVMIDWPVERGAISVFAASTGLAMLLPSSTHAPHGDDRRLTVRVAARELVLWADEVAELAIPADDVSLPGPGRIFLYLLTYEDLLRASAGTATLEDPSSRLARLLRLGRSVLDELRRSTGWGS